MKRLTRSQNRRLRLVLACAALVCGSGAAPSRPETVPEVKTPATPREFYNAGTERLRQGKLKEAESMLEAALSSQQERIQPPALYNLGHVRFAQGLEELKKGPAAGPAAARGRVAAQTAEDSLRAADQALAGADLQQLVAAYMRGRGARKELNQAMKAVRKATETCGATLRKWQRASGDFKSALELQPSADARENSEIVDRYIAQLVDSLRELDQVMQAMGDKKQRLGDKLKQMQGRIPDKDMPPSPGGDEDDEEDQPNGPKPGDKEGPTRDGEEMKLSREQAAWFLDGYKLDSEHRLPMSQEDSTEPKGRARKPW